jgi:hypothetical protein
VNQENGGEGRDPRDGLRLRWPRLFVLWRLLDGSEPRVVPTLKRTPLDQYDTFNPILTAAAIRTRIGFIAAFEGRSPGTFRT